MAQEKGKKISTLIFLFAVFVFLAFFTGGWLYRVYVDHTSFSEKSTNTAIKCSSITFGVDNLNYEGGVLSFDLENKFGAVFGNITVESGPNQTVEVPTGRLGSGDVYPVALTIDLGNSVMIYPAGCRDEYAKTFKLT